MELSVLIPTAQAAGVISDATPVSNVLLNVLGFLLSVVGVLGIIGLVVGGMMYLTAGGDEKRMKLAKVSVTASIIGLVVALGSLAMLGQIGSFFS